MRTVWILVLGFCLGWLGNSAVQAQCDFAPNAPISFQTTGGQLAAGYTQRYILTNHEGQIVDIQSQPSFAGRVAGIYIAYHVNFESSSTVTGLVVGGSIRDVEGTCLDISNPLVLSVCAGNEICDFLYSQPITFQATGGNLDPAYVQLYLLTNEVGDIIASSPTPTFPPQSSGLYLVYHVTYLATEAFETAVCFDSSNPLAIRVCEDDLVAISDQISAVAGISITIPVLANDLFNGTPLNLGQIQGPSLIVTPTKGDATIQSDGTITYLPARNQAGMDQFIYQICLPNDSTVCAQALVTVTIQGAPSVVISKAGPATANAGIPFSYTLTIINQGAAATSLPIQVVDELPPNLSFISANSTDLYSCIATGQRVDCQRTSPLGPGATSSLTLSVVGNTVGFTSNQGQVFGGGDPIAQSLATARVSNVVTTSIQNQAVRIFPKVFLYGAYDPVSGLMRDNLRANGQIPFLQPYQLPVYQDFAYAGLETVTSQVLSATGANAVVDWILVELRSPQNPAQIIFRRAALLQRDGDIVDMDGSQPVTFFGAPTGSYHLAIRHRNHLGVMTANPIFLSPTTSSLDFTFPTTPTFRLPDFNGSAFPQIVMPNGRTALWAGNATLDQRVIFQGTANDVNGVFNRVILFPGNTNQFANFIVTGYDRADLNLDGNTIYQGTGNDNNLLFMQVLSHPENQFFANNFIIYQQLP